MSTLLLVVYWIAVAGLFVYGVNCHVLNWRYRATREQGLAALARRRAQHTPPDSELPTVTVQLPIYNERCVADRIVDAVALLDWPSERLQIQVLDDSDDDTTSRLAAAVTRARARGLDVSHLRREKRTGFKAGALAEGLESAKGELVAVFDADFVPAPDVLRELVPLLLADERVALVQARWGHLNREHSWLTRAQAVAIDGHFGIEQAARCWSGWLLNFNGTAGVWRRAAIEDAGGWQADTLTEDLDLSYRAQLRGWRIEYAADVVVPAEIPTDLAAFKAQQRRWAKGSIQTALKLAGRVAAAPLPITTRVQALLHLTHYLVHPLMLAVALLALPLLAVWHGHFGAWETAIGATLLLLGATGPSALYLAAQSGSPRHGLLRRLRQLPPLMVLGTGIAVSNTRAVVEALLGVRTPFIRTPKNRDTDTARADSSPQSGYRARRDGLAPLEAGLCLWCLGGLALYLQSGRWLIGPFLLLYALGFGTVAFISARGSPAPARDEQPIAGSEGA